MWFLRRLRIACTVSNEEVLQRANTSRNLLKVIVNRQIRFVGHIVRKSQLEAIALTGMIEGKRARGRQRKTFMDWLSFACGEQCKIIDVLKICQDRNEHIWIANVRVWHGTYIGLDAESNDVIYCFIQRTVSYFDLQLSGLVQGCNHFLASDLSRGMHAAYREGFGDWERRMTCYLFYPASLI